MLSTIILFIRIIQRLQSGERVNIAKKVLKNGRDFNSRNDGLSRIIKLVFLFQKMLLSDHFNYIKLGQSGKVRLTDYITNDQI